MKIGKLRTPLRPKPPRQLTEPTTDWPTSSDQAALVESVRFIPYQDEFDSSCLVEQATVSVSLVDQERAVSIDFLAAEPVPYQQYSYDSLQGFEVGAFWGMISQSDNLSWFDTATPAIQILVSDSATFIDRIERGEVTRSLRLFDSLSLFEVFAITAKSYLVDELQAVEDANAYSITLNIYSADSSTLIEDAFIATRLQTADQIQTTDQ